MAKAQKRGNREAKKPKAVRPAPVAETSGLLSKGSSTPVSPPKKKH
ncbi:hypothetical protein [Zavarzinia sp.]